ncbi:MAG TPA: helix-hairpin-helix domain-containing protein [Candidatus Onthousia excrementipullorum]|uniref:Helix-hairpin-helix domain-containing protein n=1 Tax=Candidatus Onthousia excrementipullorum TaxID=2840884 RepID=A0A9D1DTY1_9FIRM|nr:helix-hairpin-helix domain-containing protein [Candidatus Onthousia excrementipullorum]
MTFTYRHKKQIILCGLGLVLLLVVASIFIYKNFTAKDKEDENIVLNTKKDIKKDEEEEKTSDVYYQVDIKGEVINPGIYTVKEGSRVIDVIRLAGDLTEVADTSVLNLSKKVKDEMVIIVYSFDEVESFTETKEQEEIEQEACKNQNGIENDACIEDSTNDTSSSSVVISGKISLNTATLDELMMLPGIGEAKAEAIIKYREEVGAFQNIEELKEVNGIGDAIFDDIKESITI